MKLVKSLALVLGAALLCTGIAQAQTNIIPLGTIRYDPSKAWNSYIILPGAYPKLVDRNGNLVKEWDNKGGGAMPNKVYPGGHLLTGMYGPMPGGFQDISAVAILDWDNNIVRKFNKWEQVPAAGKGQAAEEDGTFWAARQHHDYQLQGDSVGYYSPKNKANLKGNMLVLAHKNAQNKRINSQTLLDDVIYVVDKNGKVTWEWHANEHFNEFGFSEAANNHLKALNPVGGKEFGGVDWFHINCASWLGPNKWYDAGDKRFHPDNIIADSRNSSHLFIIDHKTGDVVWQVAPPFVGEDGNLGPITGVHGTHMIPQGLPGAGNIMIFDNGGPLEEDLYKDSQGHAWSRIVEFNPVTKEKVWEYSATTQKIPASQYGYSFFFSPFISIAQRLPNGNTLITEGASNRIFEVTVPGEIVWEYRNPYGYNPGFKDYITYRAYAVPYDYVPQLQKPVEVPVYAPVAPASFVMMPDANGNLPKYKSSIDPSPLVQFEEPWVITPPKKK